MIAALMIISGYDARPYGYSTVSYCHWCEVTILLLQERKSAESLLLVVSKVDNFAAKLYGYLLTQLEGECGWVWSVGVVTPSPSCR